VPHIAFTAVFGAGLKMSASLRVGRGAEALVAIGADAGVQQQPVVNRVLVLDEDRRVVGPPAVVQIHVAAADVEGALIRAGNCRDTPAPRSPGGAARSTFPTLTSVPHHPARA
jgi:hypothetical protein